MKRRITVKSGFITITALIDTAGGRYLSKSEMERARDDLADRLMHVASEARYFEEPISRIRVS